MEVYVQDLLASAQFMLTSKTTYQEIRLPHILISTYLNQGTLLWLWEPS